MFIRGLQNLYRGFDSRRGLQHLNLGSRSELLTVRAVAADLPPGDGRTPPARAAHKGPRTRRTGTTIANGNAVGSM
jgi:hypothetical protein